MSGTAPRRFVAAAALTAAAAAPCAASADSGVHVDPNSPAGKEYAIPFQSARHVSGGSGGGIVTAGTVAQAAPFGAGIRAPHRLVGRPSGPHPGVAGSAPGVAQRAAGAVLASVPRFDAPPGDGWTGAVLPAGLVLVAGAALGVMLRVRWTARRHVS